MLDWLKTINKKRIDKKNQPKEGFLKIEDTLSIDGSASIDIESKIPESGQIEIIKKF